MSSADPLAELLVDAAAVDRARIAAALKGRVAVDSTTGQVVPQAPFDQLNARQKILAFLLARKVGVLLDVADKETAAPSEVVEQTGLPAGTVRPTLSALLDEHVVSKKGTAYFITGPQVGLAIDWLSPADQPDDDSSPKTGPRRARSAKTRRIAKKPKSPKSKPTSEKSSDATRKSTSSPRALVVDLIADGFFDKPKTLADVQKRIKDKKGHNIPVTTLSPTFIRLLRSGELERSINSNGVYEYQKERAPAR